MASNIHASTPIILPKSVNRSSRISWLNQDVTQQLYHNTCVKFQHSGKSTDWDSIEGSKFVDFNEKLDELGDSFLDERKADNPTPQKKEEIMLPTSDEAAEIIQSFQSCSISTIAYSSMKSEDSTLIADNFVQQDNYRQTSTATKALWTPNCNRRQSQTVVEPFSFERREKDNQEVRESRRAYYKILSEKGAMQSFKAKPAPKFKPLLSTSTKVTEKHATAQPKTIRVSKTDNFESNIVTAVLNNEKSSKVLHNIVVPKVAKSSMHCFPIQQKAKTVTNPLPFQNLREDVHHIEVSKIKKSTTDSEGYQVEKYTANFIPILKQKPFQVCLPKRKIEVSKSPQLHTAKRTRDRQLFEEKMKKIQQHKEEVRKREIAAQQAREKEEIARLRKITVFKAKPVPHYKSVLPKVPKRPLTELSMPIFTKRRRCL